MGGIAASLGLFSRRGCQTGNSPAGLHKDKEGKSRRVLARGAFPAAWLLLAAGELQAAARHENTSARRARAPLLGANPAAAQRCSAAAWRAAPAAALQQISAVGLVNLIMFLWVVGSIIATVTYPMY